MNPLLQTAIEMMREKYPDCTYFAEENISQGHKIKTHHYRLSIVKDGRCWAGQDPDINEAFALLCKDMDAPKTEEINRSIAFLKSQGIEVVANS